MRLTNLSRDRTAGIDATDDVIAAGAIDMEAVGPGDAIRQGTSLVQLTLTIEVVTIDASGEVISIWRLVFIIKIDIQPCDEKRDIVGPSIRYAEITEQDQEDGDAGSHGGIT